jgi:hypothetical protein
MSVAMEGLWLISANDINGAFYTRGTHTSYQVQDKGRFALVSLSVVGDVQRSDVAPFVERLASYMLQLNCRHGTELKINGNGG